MALSLKLLICLLFVACAYLAVSAETTPLEPTTTPEATTATPGASTTPEATTATPATPETTTATPEATTATSEATTATPATPEATPATPEATPATPEATPATPEATTATAATPEATVTPGPPATCDSKPCGEGVTCEERADGTYICLCPTGDYHDSAQKKCVPAKVFPGNLSYKKTYEVGMADSTSVIFKETADEIVQKINDTYKDDKMYHDSIVTKLSQPTPSTTRTDTIIATVEIQFDINSQVTPEEVINKIESVGTFNVTSRCPSKPCDPNTTEKCSETSGDVTCTCKDKYVPTAYSNVLCVACPDGKKAVNGKCESCGFGYTGFNCEDNWQLILVIVGTVLGAFLLVTSILLPVVVMKSKKKSKKAKTTKNEKPYSNPAPAKTPQFSNGLAAPRPTRVQAAPAGGLSGFGGNGVPRIPRATTNDNWDRNTNLEMVPSNSRQNLIPAGRNSRRFDDQEDTNPYSRPMKPQNNPYAVGRPQVNPYASNQGHSNPYYSN